MERQPHGGTMRTPIDPKRRFVNWASPWLIAVGLGVVGIPSQADVGRWMSRGPDAGLIDTVVAHPVDPNLAYAASQHAGVFRSADGGHTWQPINTGLTIERASALAIDPAQPSTLYAGTFDDGVFRSQDGGDTWHPLFDEGRQRTASVVRTVELDPSDPSTVYVGATGGLHRSRDGGETWQELIEVRDVYGVAVDPTASHVIYAASNAEGVLRSTDDGATWVPLDHPEAHPYDIALDPTDPETLYFTYSSGVQRSTDGGATWQYLGLRAHAYRLRFDPVDPRVVYATALSGGLFRSDDGGQTWQRMTVQPAHVVFRDIDFLATPPGETASVDRPTLAATNRGVYRAEGPRELWERTSRHLVNSVITAFVTAPRDPNRAWAGTRSGEIFRTTDGGRSWQPSSRGLPTSLSVRDLAADPNRPGTLYAGLPQGLYRSTDFGATWRPLDFPERLANNLEVGPGATSQTTLYAASGLNLWRSADAGESWQSIGDGLPEQSIQLLRSSPSDPSVHYVVTHVDGVFRSVDGGQTFEPARTGLPEIAPHGLTIDPSDPSTVYAMAPEYPADHPLNLYRSVDGGDSWQLIPASTEFNARRLVVDPRDPNHLIVATQGGVVRSRDGGTSFEAIDEGLGSAVVDHLAMAPRHPGRLYAGSAGGGVHVREDVRPCLASATVLCLEGRRIQVEVDWQSLDGLRAGPGQAESLTDDTGAFWFFDQDNLELAVKTVDGRGANGHFWVFYGALTNVPFELRVLDTESGAFKSYDNPAGRFASRGDIEALPTGEGMSPAFLALAGGLPATYAEPPGHLLFTKSGTACQAEHDVLCLRDDRFTVTVEWGDFTGGRGLGQTVPLTDDTGGFWFFDPENLELLVKVIDGRELNGHFWVFYGALTNTEFTLTVTDNHTGIGRRWRNPAGNFASVGDVTALPEQ